MSISDGQQAALARIIGGIGTPAFAAIAADAVCRLMGFDLAATVQHRRGARPRILFDNFAEAGARQGIENYVRHTHGINPILAAGRPGAFRARDFRVDAARIDAAARPWLVRAGDEELGFRTLGWPERLEEIGLYVEADRGMVELGLYRERAGHGVTPGALNALAALGPPIAAAFDRHCALSRSPAALDDIALSPRERQVADLLLRGCTSEAIALRLGISRHTIKDHRKHIFRKLGIASLSALFALRRDSMI
jgi:DNA-binding CsgD family transcriptional regulator